MRRHGLNVWWSGLFAAVLLVAGIQNANSEDLISIQAVARGTPHDFLYGLSFEGNRGVAVGDNGRLLDTNDAGATWSRSDSPAAQTGLLSVVRKSGKCLAVGQQGLIVRSDDCKSWQRVTPVSDARFLAIDANSKGVAYAVGGFGSFIKSSDWGKSWSPVTIDWKALLGAETEPHLYAVSVAEDGSVVVSGEFEIVFRSPDGVGHWEVLHKGERSIFGLHVGVKGRLLAVGQEGLILLSTDNGKSWNPLESGTEAVLTDVWSSADGSTVVVVGVRTVLLSLNSAATFTASSSPIATMGIHSAVRGIDGVAGRKAVFIAGSSGEILKVDF